MKRDETIDLILQEIQEELKEELDIDISPEEIFDIANSQFIGGAVAVNKRLSYSFPYIGTFVLKNKHNYIESVKEVQKLKDKVSEEEYKAIIKEKRIANVNVMNGSQLDLIKEIKDLPDDVADSRKIYKLNAIYKELIEKERA